MDYKILIAYIVGIILIFLLGKLLLVPLKVIVKLVVNAIIGGAVLIVINIVGGIFGYHIALNIISSVIVGTFGIPGVVLLVMLKLFLV